MAETAPAQDPWIAAGFTPAFPPDDVAPAANGNDATVQAFQAAGFLARARHRDAASTLPIAAGARIGLRTLDDGS